MGALFTSERRKNVKRTPVSRCTLQAGQEPEDDAGGLMEPALMQPYVNIKPVVNMTANYLYSFKVFGLPRNIAE
jgi:hypothetical protein